MNENQTFAVYLTSIQAQPEAIASACVTYVEEKADRLSSSAMYSDLLRNAKDADAVDRMLYQLQGDPAYAEQAALIVLAAGWNQPEDREFIRTLIPGTPGSGAGKDPNERAIAVLYGMYLLARDNVALHEVTYRHADGTLESVAVGPEITPARLFDDVRDLYGVG